MAGSISARGWNRWRAMDPRVAVARGAPRAGATGDRDDSFLVAAAAACLWDDAVAPEAMHETLAILVECYPPFDTPESPRPTASDARRGCATGWRRRSASPQRGGA